MSNIPSNAMPHAGGTSTNTDDRKATQPAGSHDDTSSVSYGSQYSDRARPSGGYSAQAGTSSRQPDQYRQAGYQESDYGSRNSGSLMEKARGHKTGIALGVAVGAIAAAAIPFMFGGKKKQQGTREADYSADVYVDKRQGSAASRTGTDQSTGFGGTTGGTQGY